MRKLQTIMMLIGILISMHTFAQYSEAQFRIYEKGNAYYSLIPSSFLDSMVFASESYDVYVSADPLLNEDGSWALTLRASWGFSVNAVQVCVVPASYTEDEILMAYENGTISDIRILKDSVNTTQYILQDGSYKPVAFALDKEGIKKSHYIGKEINIFENYLNQIIETFMYSPFNNNYHFDWGYGSIMNIRNIMGDEQTLFGEISYDKYRPWRNNMYMGSGYAYAQFLWLYFDNAILKLSESIKKLDVKGVKTNPNATLCLGIAVAMRAMHYLDAARMYEYLPTDGTTSINSSGNDVLNLTYPIGYAAEDKADIRRATREEMKIYIEQQLSWAEELLQGEYGNNKSKEMVNLAVVYGLKARLYMWVEDYAQAQYYAEKVLGNYQYEVLTEAQWHDSQTGFNDSRINSWMWAMKYKAGSRLVSNGILNWTSFLSNQTNYGYTGPGIGLFSVISSSMYDRISNTDFRKRSFKAPIGHELYNKETYLSEMNSENIPDYTSLKFRPGKGDVNDILIGNVVDVPLMRIEEMHYIRFEAMAQQDNWQAAADELANYTRQNRDPEFNSKATSKQDVIDEIFLQKCIEFWGEGLNYFDYKRLNKPVTRDYDGTNFNVNERFNTTTRPAWMNFVFVKNAYNGLIEQWNNPDPSNCYIR